MKKEIFASVLIILLFGLAVIYKVNFEKNFSDFDFGFKQETVTLENVYFILIGLTALLLIIFLFLAFWKRKTY